MKRLFQLHYSPDGDDGTNTPPPAGDPDSKPRFSQHDLNVKIGAARAEGRASADTEWKSKYSALETTHTTLKSEYEQVKGTLTELEPLKEVAKEHEILKKRVRERDIEMSLIEQGCDPKRARHTRVLLTAENAIPEGEISDWKPIVETAKEIFPIAFGTAETKPPTGGTTNSGKPTGTEKPAKKSLIEIEQERLRGKK